MHELNPLLAIVVALAAAAIAMVARDRVLVLLEGHQLKKRQRDIGEQIKNWLIGFAQVGQMAGRVKINQAEQDGYYDIIVAVMSGISKYEFYGREYLGRPLIQIAIDLERSEEPPIRIFVEPDSDGASKHLIRSSASTTQEVNDLLKRVCEDELYPLLLQHVRIE